MRLRERLLSVLLCICLIVNPLVGLTALAADTVSTGTVKVTDALRVRSEPSTDSEVVGHLKNNDVVTIHKTVTAKNGDRWYQISMGDLNGYAHSNYITINAVYQTDEEFEAYLTAQGFPEDYKTALRQIHAQYPDWIFCAQPLSMTWAQALEAESVVGLNTITSPDSWKSMEYGAYNWETGSYVAFDSGGWVSAAPNLIAYYMDPRNWLDSSYIFQFEDLSFADEQTIGGIKAILPTALDKHASDLLKASKETGVSAYFLATRMAQEGSHLNGLGTGTVKGYEGYYNFFSYGAFASGGLSAVQNGAAYAKSQGWNTPYKCLKGSAERIGKYYIKLGQNTLYYQKFNFTNTASGLYAHQYMSNVGAPSSEGRIRRQAATESQLKNNITFNIPIFKSMPKEVAPMPSKTGNNDNFLVDIEVTGITSATTDTTTDDSASAGTSSSTSATGNGESSATESSSSEKTSSTSKKKTQTTTKKGKTVTDGDKARAKAAASATEKSGTKTKISVTDKNTTATDDRTPATNGTSTINQPSVDTPETAVKLELTPSFDRYTMSYSAHAGNATSVDIDVTLSNSDATVTGDGAIRLYKGDNEIPITVTATSGATRTYTLVITTNGGVDRPNAPVITGLTYKVDSTITKVEPNTTVTEFVKNLAVSNGTATVYTADGERKKDGVVGTGDILRLYNEKTLCASYPVIIYGDVNGDGKVSSLDLRIAQKHILKLSNISGYYLTAADSSKDKKLTSLDLRITQKYILKITKTLQ